MNQEINGPRQPGDKKLKERTSPQPGAGREGEDESLTESSPTDSRSDEKVIVNEQRANKTVNAPSQTAANTSEGFGNDEEILD